jgi:putative colanic acid biosynthesis UDP-glucose lipid carrier transferase
LLYYIRVGVDYKIRSRNFLVKAPANVKFCGDDQVQYASGSDFLAIRSPFRYIIQLVVPAACAIYLSWFFGWFDAGSQVLWPVLIVLTMTMTWVRFDIHKLTKIKRYRFIIFSDLFTRTLVIYFLINVIFAIDGTLDNRWKQAIYYAIFLWMLTSILTMMFVEISILTVFKRKPIKIAIAAVTSSSVAFARNLGEQKFLAIEFLGFFEDRTDDRIPDYSPFKILARIDAIADYITGREVDHVLVSLPTEAGYRFGFVLEQLLNSTCSVHYLHDFLLFRPIREAMTPIGSMSVFTIIDSPGTGIDSVVKRSFDILGSAIGLILLMPLLILVAMWIKIDSKGPVFFMQNRWGNGAHPFQIYKFRSMSQATSSASSDGETVVQTTQNDMRVTKVGAFIRRTSIDELPQLINILKGDMSIVGPRPHAAGHNKQYRGLVKGYMLRHKVKPGLTGWAQIHGFRGETDTIDKMEKRVEYDLEYLRNWTPMLDIYVILRTVKLVVTGKNAY